MLMNTHAVLSPDLKNTRILIIGAGSISYEYIRALQSLGYNNIGILSRRLGPAQELANKTGLSQVYAGGENTLPGLLNQYDAFIVATPIVTLKLYAKLFAQASIRRVLLEKPTFLYSSELEAFTRSYPEWDAALALNRLYYPSVEKMREVIASEGVTSAEFTFTEWTHRIHPENYAPIELERWGLSNCIHVIATVFDLIGLPSSLHAAQHNQTSIAWHPHGSIFLGHGSSNRRIPFAYQADWNSAGRWSITLRTPRGSYSLCPMEGIEFTAKGAVDKQVYLPAWNAATKCGFEPMLAAWLSDAPIITLSQLLPHIQAIETIFGYAPTV